MVLLVEPPRHLLRKCSFFISRCLLRARLICLFHAEGIEPSFLQIVFRAEFLRDFLGEHLAVERRRCDDGRTPSVGRVLMNFHENAANVYSRGDHGGDEIQNVFDQLTHGNFADLQ